MTGHLLLSTLHTNDAVSTVLRLIDLGIDPFLVASNVNIAVAQRLVRLICPACKEPFKPTGTILPGMEELWNELRDSGHQVYQGAGCSECRHSGYSGRIGVYEVIEFDTEMKEIILKGASQQKLAMLAQKKGMKSIRQSGMEKIAQGLTTLQEVLAACLDAEF